MGVEGMESRAFLDHRRSAAIPESTGYFFSKSVGATTDEALSTTDFAPVTVIGGAWERNGAAAGSTTTGLVYSTIAGMAWEITAPGSTSGVALFSSAMGFSVNRGTGSSTP